MKIPKSVQMGGYTIPIIQEEKVIDEDEKECFGFFDTDDYRIMIMEGMPDRKKADTFVHELVEAANELADLQLPHQTIQTLGLLLSEALMEHLKEDAPACTPERPQDPSPS